MSHRFVHEFDNDRKHGARPPLVICFVMVTFFVACTADDPQAGGKTRAMNDFTLPSGNQIRQVEVYKGDEGRVYVFYETRHTINSCSQLSEVRELWTERAIDLPEAAAASEIVLEPTDPTGRSRGWRYRKQDGAWTEWFSPQCRN
jgi:hypothetical protein